MRRFLRILNVFFTIFGLRIVANTKRNPYNEEYFTVKLSKEYGFTYAKSLPNRLRPDLYFNDHWVVEVDWADKKYEAIGQALVYSHFARKNPGVVFLVDRGKQLDARILEVMAKHNIRIWVVDIVKEDGVILKITEIP